MLRFIDKDPRLSHSQSIIITYPRTVQITFGNYPYPEDIHNLIMDVKKNINEEDSYASNVKARKTGWKEFINHPLITKFINHCINKHQVSNQDLFKHFYERKTIDDCWGNEIREGEYVRNHNHISYHGILYLTKGEPLILPELNMEIIPEPGNYYFFPPMISHLVNPSTYKDNRYNIVMNIIDVLDWKKDKEIYLKNNE
tara:strand:+ start:149 stop:745 length:597 start_codon:yes stop_codon:yes gene_type:complete